MLAHHPITGKPIRIMKTETHLHKNQKTLIWLHESPSQITNAHRMKRWETVVTSPVLAEEWRSVLGTHPSATVLREPTVEALNWIKSSAPKIQQLLFLSRAVMEAYGPQQFAKEKFMNILCLEELGEMYPHTQHKYQSQEEDAVTVLSVAALFRASRALGFTSSEQTSTSFLEYSIALNTSYGITVGPHQEPEELWLIQQYFTPDKARRAREIKRCLEKNIECEYIDKIFLLNEKEYDEPLMKPSKVQQKVLGKRMRYSDVLRTIYNDVPHDTHVVFANSDIYLDDSWRALWSLNMKDTFLSLLRYEEPTDAAAEPQLFGPREDSQDTWVVSSTSVKARQWDDFATLDFEFGKAGCDNAINIEMLRKKFIVANPSLTFRTLHCHQSAIRTYDPNNVVDKPIFLYLEPTGLHDLEPTKDIKAWEKPWRTASPFTRRVHAADEKTAATFCSMVSRKEEILLTADGDNTFTPQPEEKVYQFSNAFTTPNGLVYGYKNIYMGPQQSMREAWASTHISHVTPCIGVKAVLAAPIDDSVAVDPFKYMQSYMARILQLKAQGYEGDMWLPRDTARLQDFLQFFKWGEQVMPVIPRDPDIVGYSTTTTLLTPRSSRLIYKEDVEALREKLRNYYEKPTDKKRVVVFQDDVVLNSDDVLAIEERLESAGYEVNVVYPTRSSPSFIFQRVLGAAICITPPSFESLYWMLPKGAKVIEVMSELKIEGDGVHVAGAASLEYWVILLQRAKKDQQRQILLEKLMKTLAAAAAETSVSTETQIQTQTQTQTPTVVMPKGFDGFHGHSGDTFREMVELWQEKGYVCIEPSNQSPYVWLGGIGETLLYDRPNYDWLKHTPATYKKILCGNPDAATVPSGVQWSFWPRRPRLVEERVKKPLPAWSERDKTCVFYGKVENLKQHKHRANDLFNLCDEFDMPIGVEKEYKYTQEQYLDALASSKFGLCMAGFGPKCNREIECFAMGTVPVVAPDVDMDKYHNSPKEGVHYIRLKSFDAEEAHQVLDKITQDVWSEMSAAGKKWWADNASADGLWRLTQEICK
jgi:hypothetical protein